MISGFALARSCGSASLVEKEDAPRAAALFAPSAIATLSNATYSPVRLSDE